MHIDGFQSVQSVLPFSAIAHGGIVGTRTKKVCPDIEQSPEPLDHG